jgi:hypothetical protein
MEKSHIRAGNSLLPPEPIGPVSKGKNQDEGSEKAELQETIEEPKEEPVATRDSWLRAGTDGSAGKKLRSGNLETKRFWKRSVWPPRPLVVHTRPVP